MYRIFFRQIIFQMKFLASILASSSCPHSQFDSKISTDTKLFGIFLWKYLDVEYIMDFIR